MDRSIVQPRINHRKPKGSYFVFNAMQALRERLPALILCAKIVKIPYLQRKPDDSSWNDFWLTMLPIVEGVDQHNFGLRYLEACGVLHDYLYLPCNSHFEFASDILNIVAVCLQNSSDDVSKLQQTINTLRDRSPLQDTACSLQLPATAAYVGTHALIGCADADASLWFNDSVFDSLEQDLLNQE